MGVDRDKRRKVQGTEIVGVPIVPATLTATTSELSHMAMGQSLLRGVPRRVRAGWPQICAVGINGVEGRRLAREKTRQNHPKITIKSKNVQAIRRGRGKNLGGGKLQNALPVTSICWIS